MSFLHRWLFTFKHFIVSLNTFRFLLPLLPLSISSCLIEIKPDNSLSVNADMSFPQPTFQELEESAQAVIGYLKTFSEYSNVRVSIIGGMALWKYFPHGRTTTVSIEEIAYSDELFPSGLAGRGFHSHYSGCPKQRQNQIASASKYSICTIRPVFRLQTSGWKEYPN